MTTELTKVLPFGINEKIENKTFATGTVDHDISLSSIFYHTLMASNFKPNLTNLPTHNNRSHVVVLILEQTDPAYYINGLQINGSDQTIKWFGDVVPTPTTDEIDIVSFTILRISNSWKVFGQSVYFGK
jgi:hypothetical protein